MSRDDEKRSGIKVSSHPTGTEVPTAVVIIVVAGIIIVLLFAIIPFLLNSFNPTPNIIISNINGLTSSCISGKITYTYTFTLTNNGNANGNATVAISFINTVSASSGPLKTGEFYVPKATTTNPALAYTQNGCTPVYSATNDLAVKILSQKPVS